MISNSEVPTDEAFMVSGKNVVAAKNVKPELPVASLPRDGMLTPKQAERFIALVQESATQQTKSKLTCMLCARRVDGFVRWAWHFIACWKSAPKGKLPLDRSIIDVRPNEAPTEDRVNTIVAKMIAQLPDDELMDLQIHMIEDFDPTHIVFDAINNRTRQRFPGTFQNVVNEKEDDDA